jgi:hypothetical protein
MKERLGFVSNSSSASYYVIINQGINDVLTTIAEECWYPNLANDNLLSRLNKFIESTEARLKDIENKRESFLLFDSKPELESRLADYKSMKQIVLNKIYGKDVDESEIVKIGFKLGYITVKDINGIRTELEASTSMHNSYADMPDLLQEIVFYYSSEHPELISFKVEKY